MENWSEANSPNFMDFFVHLKFMNEVGLAEKMFYYEFHGISHRDIEFNFNNAGFRVIANNVLITK